MSGQRFVIGFFIISAILVGMVVQAAAVSAFAQFSYPDSRIGGLVSTSTVMAVLAAFVSFGAFIRNADAMKFTTEVVNEVSQVTWPTKDETVRASTTVVFTTFFVAALLSVYDFIWANVADIFLFTEI
jgi:preprotein translocase SecE subunit